MRHHRCAPLALLLPVLLSACAGTSSITGQNANPSLLTHTPSQSDAAAMRASADHTVNLDRGESVQALANSNDLWSRIRSGFQLPDLDGDLVQAQLDWYTTRPDYVARMTDRSRLYLFHIVEELERRHMPTELALLPFIESAYNPQALSIAKAAGMWQFVPGTGRTYNLRQNMFQDERRDVLASTSAALDYLSNLHDMFGDWQLALAAYNWGEGNVQKAVARNEALGLPTDYADLHLPNETRNYVPKLQAVKDIIENPAKYGLSLPPIPNHPYFITVTTSHDIDVKVAAQLADLTTDEFKALNPSFTKPVILGATDSQILLPFDNAESFERNLRSYRLPLSSWTTYTISQRERPAALAAKIGIDTQTLLSVNKIPAGMRLKPGSTVLVPKSDDAPGGNDISANVAETAVLSIEPDTPDTRRVLIRVGRRETLSTLAGRYHVSVAQLRGWNRLRGTIVPVGYHLVLHVPVTTRYADDDAPRAMPLATVRVSAPMRGRVRGGIMRVSDAVDRAPEPRASGRSAGGRPGKAAEAAPSRGASHAASGRTSAKAPTRDVRVTSHTVQSRVQASAPAPTTRSSGRTAGRGASKADQHPTVAHDSTKKGVGERNTERNVGASHAAHAAPAANHEAHAPAKDAGKHADRGGKSAKRG